MLGKPLQTVNRLLLFIIILLQQYASTHVVRLRDPTEDPVEIPSLTIPRDSLLLPPNATSISQEEPPFEFRCEYFWKARGVPFNPFGFYNTMIVDVAGMALKDWNQPAPFAKFIHPYGIGLGFASDRTGPGLKTKHILWTLEEIFDIIVEQKRYAPGTVVVDLGTTRLGVASVSTVAPESALMNKTNTLEQGLADTPSLAAALEFSIRSSDHNVKSALPASQQGNTTLIQTLPMPELSPNSPSLTARRSRKIEIHYFPDSADIDDVQIYNASIKLLTLTAEPSDKISTIWPKIATYNVMDDFTLTYRPLSYRARAAMTWLDAIFAIPSVVDMMQHYEGHPGGLWAEMQGRVVVDDVEVGRFCLNKGNWMEKRPEELCNRPFDGSSAQVATA